jgi:hypothetical protein
MLLQSQLLFLANVRKRLLLAMCVLAQNHKFRRLFAKTVNIFGAYPVATGVFEPQTGNDKSVDVALHQ